MSPARIGAAPAARHAKALRAGLAALFISGALGAGIAAAAGSGLDPSFGEGGSIKVDIEDRRLSDVVVDELNRPVALLHFEGAVARFDAGGSLDESFGEGGVADLRLPEEERYAKAIALDDRGRILVATMDGYVGDEDGYGILRVVRLLPSGEYDPSFGAGGTVEVDEVKGRFALDIAGIAVDGKGRIVVAGGTTPRYREGVPSAVRLDRNGRLDESFAGDGVFELSRTHPLAEFADEAVDMDMDARGRLAIAATGVECLRRDRFGACKRVKRGSVALRLRPAGKPVRSFGRRGVQRAFGLRGMLGAVDVERSRTLLAGARRKGGKRQLIVARLDRDGHNERSFNRGRPRQVELDAEAAAADLLTGDGAIYVAATSDAGKETDLAVAKLNRKGRPDRSFGARGVATADTATPEFASALAAGPDGRPVLGATAGSSYRWRVVLARFLP